MQKRLLSLFALFLAMLPMEAQPVQKTFHVIDPGIPGVEIITPDNPEFAKVQEEIADAKYIGKHGFFLKNTTNHTILGAAIAYEFEGQRHLYIIDGVSPALNVRTGQYVMADAGFMGESSAHGGVVSSFSSTIPPTEASVDLIVFDDGRVYGKQVLFDGIEKKSTFKRQFLKRVQAAGSTEAFLADMVACIEKGKCEGVAREDMDILRDTLEDYKATHQVFNVPGVEFARLHQSMLSRFPKSLRFMGKREPPATTTSGEHASLLEVTPKDSVDGWSITDISMSCANGSPAYLSRYVGNGCTYPSAFGANPPTQPLPTGALIEPSYAGFIAGASATCLQRGSNGFSSLNYLRDGLSAGRIIRGDPRLADYAPRDMVYANFSTNFNTNPNWTDILYGNLLVGVSESHAAQANADGGTTICSVMWSSDINPFTVVRNDWLWSASPSGIAPLYSDAGNLADGTLPVGTRVFWPAPYGYVEVNRKKQQFCNSGYASTEAPFPGVNTQPSYSRGASANTICTHTPPPTANNNNPCNPSQEWCCCMAAYDNWEMCVWMGLTPNDLTCPTSGTAYTHLTSTGQTPTYGGGAMTISRAAMKPAVFRTGYPTGTLLADNIGSYNYDSTNSITWTGFFVPGGIQGEDKAVAGDWRGIGKTGMGIYRPSTGKWYVDANYNGVWDGNAGGDYEFTFGGDPSDVPIVGDWSGGGQGCAGVFRYGFLWVLDVNCNRQWDGVGYGLDNQFAFGGAPGDVPVVGKWGGLANTQVGVVRCYIAPGQSTCSTPGFLWILDAVAGSDIYQSDHGTGLGMTGCGQSAANAPYNSYCTTPAPFAFGGLPGDVYIPGDWQGSGISRAAVYRTGSWVVDIDGKQGDPFIFAFGGVPSLDTPLVGRW